MVEEITAWLNGPHDYQAGVALYEQFGSSGSMKRILRVGGPSKKNQETLLYELQRLIRNAPAARPQAMAGKTASQNRASVEAQKKKVSQILQEIKEKISKGKIFRR